MLVQRILTALLLLPLAVAAILLPPTWLFALLAAALFLAAGREWTQLCGLRGPLAQGAALLVLALALGTLWSLRASRFAWPLMLLAGVAWWGLSLYWMRAYSFAAAPTRENRALKLLAGLLVLLPAWTALVDVHGHGDHGHWWTVLALAIVWAADSGAYFAGRFFGRRKLAPRISPGKTWAGVYGALAAGALVVVVGGWWLGVRDVRLLGLAVLGVLTVAASIVGDLFESLLKRHADIKDSGTLFPGHGGLLDRLDSVFAALPVFAAGKILLGL